VTHTLSLDALADGTARQGAVADLGAQFAEEYLVIVRAETGTAPAAGGRHDVYLASSHSTSHYPAGLTGSDGAWPSDSNEDEWALQVGPPVVSLIVTNDADTTQTQGAVIWRPAGRYVIPIWDNNSAQALRDQATATDNTSRIIIVPRNLVVVD
jgi:hypothetical protein